jgi:predicted nucleic acid-binding protein
MPADFLDTNVLIYLLSGDAAKAERAEALLREDAVVSVQVLNELANVLRRKLNFPWNEMSAFLEDILALAQIVPLDVEVHREGMRISRRYGLSVYDAMIVAAARAAECETLWSEDMHDGLVVDEKMVVRNPFKVSD